MVKRRILKSENFSTEISLTKQSTPENATTRVGKGEGF
jgi:hypothetical protein